MARAISLLCTRGAGEHRPLIATPFLRAAAGAAVTAPRGRLVGFGEPGAGGGGGEQALISLNPTAVGGHLPVGKEWCATRPHTRTHPRTQNTHAHAHAHTHPPTHTRIYAHTHTHTNTHTHTHARTAHTRTHNTHTHTRPCMPPCLCAHTRPCMPPCLCAPGRRAASPHGDFDCSPVALMCRNRAGSSTQQPPRSPTGWSSGSSR